VIITVDAESALPAYEQLREQISTMISSGVLGIGARLPTIRQLSRDLDLAPGTVSRAYRELETEGVIETRGRHGTFITSPPHLTAPERRSRLTAEASRFTRIAEQLGASTDEAIDAVRQAQRRNRR
jgi:DNA-binding transcriptional regulator YhcF (GntR family)